MDLRQQLVQALEGKTVVVMGIGNPCRGDDGAGSRIAQRLSSAPGVHVIDAQDVPENYVRQVVRHRPDAIVLIDAVEMDSPPASVALLDLDQTTAYWPSTHRLPISLLVDYLEAETHAKIALIAIQPRQTAHLEPLSAEVAEVIEHLAAMMNEILAERRDVTEPDSHAA